MKILSAFLAFSLILNQTVAIAQTTEANLQIASTQITATDPNAVVNAAAQMEVTIDQHTAELAQEDQAANQEMSAADLARHDRRVNRWQKRLTKASDKASKRFNSRVDGMDEATLRSKIAEMTANAEASGQSDLASKIDENYSNPAEAKANLKTAFATNAQNMIPTVAENIVSSGGALPYMLKLRAQIHEQRTELAKAIQSKGKASRAVASISRGAVELIVLAGLLVLLIFGAIFSIAILVSLALLGLVIESVILCAEAGSACVVVVSNHPPRPAYNTPVGHHPH